MMFSIQDWLFYLKQAGNGAGFPLVIGGLGLMLFGWRMWKLCVMASFAVIGTASTAWLIGPSEHQWLYAISGGAALALISYWPVNSAVAILGGLIGCGFVVHALSNLGLSNTPLWIGGACGFIGCTACSALNRQHIVIVVTAFIGAVLLLSGLAAWIMGSQTLMGTFRVMSANSSIVLPFIVLVPTVMSSFYQIAESKRSSASL